MGRFIALIAGIFSRERLPRAAAAYPSRTIHLVAGTAPAASPTPSRDTRPTACRPGSDGLVVVENKAGHRQSCDRHVAKSAPDGYTLLLVAGGNVVITPFLYASLPFDPLNDIVPVFNIAGAPQLLLVPARCRSRTSPSSSRSPARTRES